MEVLKDEPEFYINNIGEIQSTKELEVVELKKENIENENGFFILQVLLEKDKLRALLDTGASHSVISSKVAERLKVKEAERKCKVSLVSEVKQVTM